MRAAAARCAVVALVLAAAGVSACVRVAPYERETLARRDMATTRNPDLAYGEDHAHAYREGSSGGGEAKGGGCGCN
jgi:Domain of unknown function (DUF4266)